MPDFQPLSVLLPVYNTRSDWLEHAVDSIINQTYQNYELIIIDDGSTNKETLECLRSLNGINPRTRVEGNPKNLGLPETLNRGLSICKHRWVARMDADDEADPFRFEKQMSYLSSHPNIRVLGANIKIMGKDAEVIFPEKHADIALQLFERCALSHPSIIYDKFFILNEMGGYHEVWNAEDYDLWSRIALQHPGTLGCIQKPLLYYRVVEGRKEYQRIQALSHKAIQQRYIQKLGLDLDSYSFPLYFDGINSPNFSAKELFEIEVLADLVQERIEKVVGKCSTKYSLRLMKSLYRYYRKNMISQGAVKFFLARIIYQRMKMKY